MYIVGENIADNDTQYIMYKLGGILQQLGQGTVLGLAGTVDVIGSVAYGLQEYGATINSNKEKGVIGQIIDKVLDATGLGFITDIIDFFGNLNTAIMSPLRGFSTDQLESMNLNTPYVRFERGLNYAGIAPEYGTVSQTTSSSRGLSLPNGFQLLNYTNVGSTEEAYGLAVDAAYTGLTTQEKIASLNDIEDVEVPAVVSSETAEALSKSITLQDVYTELFIEQNYPIRVHLAYFDDDAMNQLRGDAHMDAVHDSVQYLRNQAAGSGINIDLDTNDAYVLSSQIYNVRES
jgi:hypothetical protein